jgi:hypothetical protein
MTTETDAKPAPKTTKKPAHFSETEWDSFCQEYRRAENPEARAKVVAGDPELLREGVRRMRRLEQEALPFWCSTTERLAENSIYDKLVLVKDAAVAGALGYGAYRLAKFGYAWLKGP